MYNLNGYKILIVDDDEEIRDVVKTKLELYNAQCDEAEDGLIAFEKIKNQPYDCVITDIRMPNASGLDLVKMIKEYQGKAPKIVMMSGFTDITNEKAKQLGTQGLYMKPDDLNNLLDMIVETF